ncbi:MAG: hypothetical protein HYX72_06865 [Acidobacteria bacterium]|nr:hypothetical protein [Acidobacteriota bacterium]
MELNEQTLEQILIRQREEYQEHLDEVRGDLRQYVDKASEENRLHMGVLTEGLRSDLKLIAEAQVGLREQLLEQREVFQRSLNVLAEDLGSAIKHLSEILQGIQKGLMALRNLVAKNTEDIEMMKTDLEVIKAELSIIRRDLKEKAGRDELAVLEARVAKLEMSQRSRL